MGISIPTVDRAPTVAFEDAVQYVFDALGEVPDFRDPRGTQIELRGTLALAVLSAAAGHPSYRAIEAYGKLREDTLIPLLGLDRAPSYSTIRRIVQGVDPEAMRKVLRESARVLLADKRKLVASKDGKTMRAARIEDKRSAHMVSLVEQNTGIVMDVDYCKEGEGELTAARRLRGKDAAGKAEIAAETADALYTNAPDAERAVADGEVYVVKIKKTRRTSSKRRSCASSRARPSPTSGAAPTSVTAA
jgi:hypothetical protein